MGMYMEYLFIQRLMILLCIVIDGCHVSQLSMFVQIFGVYVHSYHRVLYIVDII